MLIDGATIFDIELVRRRARSRNHQPIADWRCPQRLRSSHPTYPGNMACIGASATRVLERFFGRDDIGFSVTWVATDGPNITRQYNGFRQLADEEAASRIYGGIHFTFDTLAGFGVCVPLADYAFANYLRPRVVTQP